MASLIGTIRSSLGDQWWFIKVAVAVYVLYFLVNNAPKIISSNEILVLLYVMTFIIFLGYAIISMNHNINNKYPLFPGVTNVLDIILKSIGSVCVSIIPVIIGSAIVYIISTIHLPIVLKNIFYGLAILFMLPFIIIPLVLYSARGKLMDAFRFGIILNAAGNFVMNFVLFALQFVVIFGIIYVCLFYFLQQMFGVNNLATEILRYTFVVISFFTSMVYFSDLYDDIIPVIETKN